DLRGLDDVRSLPLETPSISASSTRAFFTPYTSQYTPLLEGQGQGATAGAAAATAAGVAPGTTVKDPSGQRCGAAPDAKAAETLQACARDASAYISKRQVETKQALSVAGCKEVVDNCRGAVMIAYPMGLPEYDPITLLMDFDTDLSATAIGQGMLDAETATLWWAGKEFHRDQTVGDRVGRNEKTKI
ncbi:cfap298-a, partial [Symbiodinium sp. KB8]